MGNLENMNEYYIILSHYKGSCLLVNATYIHHLKSAHS